MAVLQTAPPRPFLSLTPFSSFLHSHFLRTAKAELKVNWAWWVPRCASSREPASGPWPAASSSAATFSTSQPPSCWWDSMWELSRGYRVEETQPTRSPASRSSERSSESQEDAVSWRKKDSGKCKHTYADRVKRNFLSLLTVIELFFFFHPCEHMPRVPARTLANMQPASLPGPTVLYLNTHWLMKH